MVVLTPLSRRQDGQVGACPVALPLKVKDHPAPRTLGPQGLHSGPRLPRPVSNGHHTLPEASSLPRVLPSQRLKLSPRCPLRGAYTGPA